MSSKGSGRRSSLQAIDEKPDIEAGVRVPSFRSRSHRVAPGYGRSESWSGYVRLDVSTSKAFDNAADDVDNESVYSDSTVKSHVTSVQFFPQGPDIALGVTAEGQLVWDKLEATADGEDVAPSTLVNPVLEPYESMPDLQSTTVHYQKLQELFTSWDVDKDGRVSRDEILKVLTMEAAVNSVKLTPDMIEHCVQNMMDKADVDNDGYLEFSEFAALMYGLKSSKPKFLDFLPSLSGKFGDIAETMPERPTAWDWVQGIFFSRVFRQEVRFYISNNWRQTTVLVVWLLLCGFFFWWQFAQHMMYDPLYKFGRAWLAISKGSAEVVKLNMAILLFVVCKTTMTWLRETFLGRAIPFDDRLEFHKLVAGMVILTSFTHSIGFYLGTYKGISESSPEFYSSVLGLKSVTKPPTYIELSLSDDAKSGYILWGVLILITLFALKAVRKWFAKYSMTKFMSGFGAFWWSHLLLFPAFYVITFFHGSVTPFPQFPSTTTWKYLVGPVVLYVLERVQKIFLSRTIGQLEVIKAEILPGKVLALHFSCPPFQYRSGTYVFIQVPAVSRFEWHPFSVTSASSDFTLSVHIRAVGDWTNAMLKFWENEIRKSKSIPEPEEEGSSVLRNIGRRAYPMRYVYPKVLVNGPFGAPAQDYEKFRVIMLVGAGIGVTPFASVLRDVLHKSKHQDKYPNFKVEKVYFYWSTREQESFKWFNELLKKTAEEDEYGIIEMNNYLTSAYGDDDPKAFLLKTVQALYHEQEGIDIIAGTKVKVTTHTSRPKWDEIFSGVAEKTPNTKIGVFFCGPPALQKELSKNCHKHTVIAKNGTTFVFRKENF